MKIGEGDHAARLASSAIAAASHAGSSVIALSYPMQRSVEPGIVGGVANHSTAEASLVSRLARPRTPATQRPAMKRSRCQSSIDGELIRRCSSSGVCRRAYDHAAALVSQRRLVDVRLGQRGHPALHVLGMPGSLVIDAGAVEAPDAA